MTSAPSTPDETTGARRRFRFSLRSLLLWTAGVAVLFCVFRMFLNAVQTAQRAAITSAAQCSLNQLLLALHNYHDAYGRFPPAYVAGPEGKPMHSWRLTAPASTHLLPPGQPPLLAAAQSMSEGGCRLLGRPHHILLTPGWPTSEGDQGEPGLPGLPLVAHAH